MFKAGKDGQLKEYSLKQREHWLLYLRDSASKNVQPNPRPPTPFPFVEPVFYPTPRKNA